VRFLSKVWVEGVFGRDVKYQLSAKGEAKVQKSGKQLTTRVRGGFDEEERYGGGSTEREKVLDFSLKKKQELCIEGGNPRHAFRNKKRSLPICCLLKSAPSFWASWVSNFSREKLCKKPKTGKNRTDGTGVSR